MPSAVSLKCVDDSGDHVRALWEEAAGFEVEPSMAALGYPPHLTLAVYEAVPREALDAAVAAVGAALRTQHLRFDSVRSFAGSPLVLWAAPEPSEDLARAHAVLHRLIDPALCHPHYRPEAWVPHCSLATRVAEGREAAALAWAAAARACFSVTFGVVDCVSFPPVRVLAERRLEADGGRRA